jgi:hypothetical protein
MLPRQPGPSRRVAGRSAGRWRCAHIRLGPGSNPACRHAAVAPPLRPESAHPELPGDRSQIFTLTARKIQARPGQGARRGGTRRPGRGGRSARQPPASHPVDVDLIDTAEPPARRPVSLPLARVRARVPEMRGHHLLIGDQAGDHHQEVGERLPDRPDPLPRHPDEPGVGDLVQHLKAAVIDPSTSRRTSSLFSSAPITSSLPPAHPTGPQRRQPTASAQASTGCVRPRPDPPVRRDIDDHGRSVSRDTDRWVRAHLEVATRNHGSPQVGGQPGRAHPARFPAPQKNGPAVGVTVMSHPRLRSCLSSSAGSCGTFTIR